MDFRQVNTKCNLKLGIKQNIIQIGIFSRLLMENRLVHCKPFIPTNVAFVLKIQLKQMLCINIIPDA